jgi:hypothetical protein
MEGEYSHEWAELRRLRRRIFRVAAAGAVILILGAVPLVPTYVSLSSAKIIGLVLFAAWVIVLLRFFFVSGEYVYWSCPRCGKPYHYLVRWYGRWNNPFARHCVHCGLPKWVDSDPDPKLKRQLDPFRSDSIFKLGQ